MITYPLLRFIGICNKSKLILIMLLFITSISILPSCVSTEKRKQANAMRELGLSYIHEGNIEDALRQLTKAKELDPKNARVHHELGLAFFAKKLLPEAELEIKLALKYNKKLTEAWLNLGSVYLAQEKYKEAIDCFNIVTRDYLYYYPARAYNNIGWAKFKLGKYDEAISAYEQALKISPNFCQSAENLAKIYEEQRNDQETAVQYLEQASNSCPLNMSIKLSLGILQIKLDRKDDAILNFKEVIKTESENNIGKEARKYLQILEGS